MAREDILEKSRSENRNQDVYEKEILWIAGNAGAGGGMKFCAPSSIGGLS